MRYITDTDGYVKEVSFGADIVCDGNDCTEYTGRVPTGYSSLEAWYLAEVEKLYRWKIVSGNLTLDSSAVAPVEGDDSGWITPTLTSAFKAYSEGTTPKYRKVGKLVEVRGAISCASTIEGGTTEHTIFTLPSGYYPTDTERAFVCQGSGQSQWLLRVKVSGLVSFSRYHNADGYSAASSSSWLSFSAMYFVD